jgi:glycosyltransferase involved in cell wall biosynthesis
MYNVELYIQKCLDSFVIPEAMDELEVLVINDATPDGSRALADIRRKISGHIPDH